MLVIDKKTIEKESTIFVQLILKELVTIFGKTKFQALELIDKAKVYDSLIEDPKGLHDPPNRWALSVLTQANDLQALNKYYFE
jgi:hypothetical protein